jgi:hypothetical protein
MTDANEIGDAGWNEAELEAIDKWRRQEPGFPSRPEAIRRLVKVGLGGLEVPN